MNANEILTAIPRQKVKNTNRMDLRTGDVIDIHEGRVFVKIGDNTVAWNVEDCEPVPEEPRAFRCGDRVAISCDRNPETFATITAKNGTSYRTTASGSGWVHESLKQLRHASPQECKDYFN